VKIESNGATIMVNTEEVRVLRRMAEIAHGSPLSPFSVRHLATQIIDELKG